MIQWEGRLRPRREVIAELYAAGVPVADIARRLSISYSTTYITLQSVKSTSSIVSLRSNLAPGPGTKSERMRTLFGEGMSVAEVARSMGVDYAFAYGVAQRAGFAESAAQRRGRTPTDETMASEQPLAPPTGPSNTRTSGPVDAILLGCVKTKDVVPRAAKDLYISPLFRGRRRYAEASGKPWWIVSAEYGLLAPDEVVAPYDTRIAERPLAERQQIAKQVADRLSAELGPLPGKRLELHAGIEYAEAIGPELRRRGAELVRPMEGVGFGRQLAWYAGHGTDLSIGTPVEAAFRPRGPRTASTLPLGNGRGLARQITEVFVAGRLDLSGRAGAPAPGWDGMPEVVAAKRLRELGADDVIVRRFLTFNAAMDRARDADRLAVAATRLHGTAAWVFDPAEIARRPLAELTDALRVGGVSQRHSADAFAWRMIGETLASSDRAVASRGAIELGGADARDLLAELAMTTPSGSPLFPLLGGPKIGPLWVRLLAYPGGAQITSLEVVPVAVDVQVRKVTEYLGVTETGKRDLEDVRVVIQRTWAEDVARHGAAGPGPLAGTPGALDPALWFYAKWGCTFCEQAGRKRPIAEPCGQCRFPARGGEPAVPGTPE